MKTDCDTDIVKLRSRSRSQVRSKVRSKVMSKRSKV